MALEKKCVMNACQYGTHQNKLQIIDYFTDELAGRKSTAAFFCYVCKTFIITCQNDAST